MTPLSKECRRGWAIQRSWGLPRTPVRAGQCSSAVGGASRLPGGAWRRLLRATGGRVGLTPSVLQSGPSATFGHLVCCSRTGKTCCVTVSTFSHFIFFFFFFFFFFFYRYLFHFLHLLELEIFPFFFSFFFLSYCWDFFFWIFGLFSAVLDIFD